MLGKNPQIPGFLCYLVNLTIEVFAMPHHGGALDFEFL